MRPHGFLLFELFGNSEQLRLFEERGRWGIPEEIKENGRLKRQWIPKGVVIPSFSGDMPIKIKIRRSDWIKGDSFPKYVEVSGSSQSLSIYGDRSKPVMIVESELDAMLIQQYAAHLVCCVALGGVSKKPDVEVHEWLKQASLILLSLDFDDPGKKRYAFWMKQYPNLCPWPAPNVKSIGDAILDINFSVVGWIMNRLSIT